MNAQQLEQHKLIVERFKTRIEDCNLTNYTDDELEKWLTVRNYHVNEAEQAFRKSLKWRKTNRMDELLASGYEFPEVIKKYFSLGICCGYDKFKCPIVISAWGRNDLRGLVQCLSKKDASCVIRYILEESARSYRNSGGQISAIVDVQDLSIKQICNKRGIEFMLEMLSTLENNYPDRIRKAFIINAQAPMPMLLKIAKPFLSKVNKISMYGSDKDEWTRALLEEIDPDQLPAYYGGTLTDTNGDPKCPHLFNMGGQIPRHYYLSNNLPVPKEDMDSITLLPGVAGFKKLKFGVSISNSNLSWEFLSEGGDLSYYIYYKSENGEIVDLVPSDRVDSHLIMEIGQITCENTGKYVFVFDNTFSYVQVKKVRYIIKIEPPANCDDDSVPNDKINLHS